MAIAGARVHLLASTHDHGNCLLPGAGQRHASTKVNHHGSATEPLIPPTMGPTEWVLGRVSVVYLPVPWTGELYYGPMDISSILVRDTVGHVLPHLTSHSPKN